MTKKNNQKANGRSKGNGRHPVRVEFSHPTATAVAIAGTFNDWRPEATPMVAMGEGRWLKELVLPPGRYEYLFVVDGRWLADPLAQATITNPFGGVNSVVNVPREQDGNAQGKGEAR
ncbi:MAG TPA: glycogen-binding domain-containing protein [Verrucomicrobiae bacterium]